MKDKLDRNLIAKYNPFDVCTLNPADLEGCGLSVSFIMVVEF